MKITDKHVELFVRACLIYDEFPDIEPTAEDIRDHIDKDWWMEFPCRSVKRILERYHDALDEEEHDDKD